MFLWESTVWEFARLHMKKLLYLFLGLVVVGGGCQNSKEDFLYSNSSASTSSINVTSTVSSIDKNNPETWPRFEFKELGFSVQLPFPTSIVTSSYHACQPYDTSPGCYDEAKKPFEWFMSFAQTPDANYHFFLKSISKDYSYCCEVSPLNMYDFYYDGKNFRYSTQLPFIMSQPLPFYIEKNLVVIFDLYPNFYKLLDEENGLVGKEAVPPYHIYAVAIKLPNSKQFKSVILQFEKDEITLENLIKLVKTIKFD